MPECKGDMKPMAKAMPMPSMPGSYIVYFDHNSAEIMSESKYILGI